MGRSARKNMPPGLEELGEHGVPGGWHDYWHGKSRGLARMKSRWQWKSSRSLDARGQLQTGSGSEGTEVLYLADQFWVYGDKRVPSLERLGPERVFCDTNSGPHLLHGKEGDWTVSFVAKDERSVQHKKLGDFLNGQPLAIFPGDEEGDHVLFYSGAEGLMYRKFYDFFSTDSGEYVACDGKDYQLLAQLNDVERRGLLLRHADGLVYINPDLDAQHYNPPFEPGGARIAGDPYEPAIAFASSKELAVHRGTSTWSHEADGEIVDWDLFQEGEITQVVWIERSEDQDNLCVAIGDSATQKIPLGSGNHFCRSLPRGTALVAGQKGVRALHLLSGDEEELLSGSVEDLEVVVRDESETDIFAQGPHSLQSISGELF